MKKKIFIAIALLTGAIVFAQQKNEKQIDVPPPPPPSANIHINQVPPPPVPPLPPAPPLPPPPPPAIKL